MKDLEDSVSLFHSRGMKDFKDLIGESFECVMGECVI